MLVGLGQPDDAAVYRIDQSRVMVATVDFFTPIVDDPFDYGAIAAANALSDLYAMGVDPLFALNIAAMPASLDLAVVKEIMRGGAVKVREADAVIAGGHSITDDEPKYGLVALGICEADALITKTGATVGNLIVLTKPIGTGVTTTALRAGEAAVTDVQDAVRWMSTLNRSAAAVARAVGVNSGTDVTGYSLLGHAVEVSEASGVQLQFFLNRIPFLVGARKYAELWKFPAGSFDNKEFFQDRVEFKSGMDDASQMLLFDAQTSGGLLLFVDGSRLDAFSAEAKKVGMEFWLVGEVAEGRGVVVHRSDRDRNLPVLSKSENVSTSDEWE